MKFPNKDIVENIRRKYPVGTRVELLEMEDAQAPPIGTHGTVTGVDDTGSIMVQWDNGFGLHIIYGVDKCYIVHSVKTVCYGKTDIWDTRAEAEQFFLRAMAGSEGSERNRYANIYTKLKIGMTVCTDED